MRYRDYKNFRPNQEYHLYNRGNKKEEIFKDPSDYNNFIKRIKLILGMVKNKNSYIRPLPENAFSIISYCLMPNHFHFYVRQNSEVGVDKFMLKLCTSYSAYFNKKYDSVGNIFQDTFKSKIVESDSYGMYLSAYIHNNPLNPYKYPFSSLGEVLGTVTDGICDIDIILNLFGSVENYKIFFENCRHKNNEILNNLLVEL